MNKARVRVEMRYADESYKSLLSRFKSLVKDEKIIIEIRLRERYEPPGRKKRRKKREAEAERVRQGEKERRQKERNTNF